jgi:hypothetical protein
MDKSIQNDERCLRVATGFKVRTILEIVSFREADNLGSWVSVLSEVFFGEMCRSPVFFVGVISVFAPASTFDSDDPSRLFS